jgi:hypothetical protein
MPSDKLQKFDLEFHIDIADISKNDANKLCEYIQDYLLKNYKIINCDYKVIDGECYDCW